MTSPHGILLLDKPQGLTSHDVVARVRRAANTRKVGHAGTLDPMATGLLIVGLGMATRLLTHVVGADKVYEATIRLGEATNTDDAEGEQTGKADASAVAALADAELARAVAALTGDLLQVPSSVSAIKVDGERAYARVRAGEQVELAARPVTVSAFEVRSIRRLPEQGVIDLDVRVACSSGTYIRALARDLGAALGVGGHLTALRRTAVGPFDVASATPLAALTDGAVAPADVLLAPADAATRLVPRLDLDEQQAVDLGHGKKLALAQAGGPGIRAAIAPDGRLVALVSVSKTGVVRVETGFPQPEAQP